MEMKDLIPYKIKENSFTARIAASVLRAEKVAMVIGKVIHLHNTKREEFEKNERWLRHELCHIRQFREHGFIPFLLKYLLETIKRGYYNNRFEVEARKAEL